MKPTIEVETVYGFCHNWTLVLPATKKHPAQRFWLGQDVKFCERVLGMSPEYILYCINQERGTNYTQIDVSNPMLARFIVRCLGGTRYMRTQEPWAFAAQ